MTVGVAVTRACRKTRLVWVVGLADKAATLLEQGSSVGRCEAVHRKASQGPQAGVDGRVRW